MFEPTQGAPWLWRRYAAGQDGPASCQSLEATLDVLAAHYREATTPVQRKAPALNLAGAEAEEKGLDAWEPTK
jgi:hypothetical protein